MLRLCSLFLLRLTPRGHNSTPYVSNGPLTQPLMLAESSHTPDIKAPAHLSLIRPFEITSDIVQNGVQELLFI